MERMHVGLSVDQFNGLVRCVFVWQSSTAYHGMSIGSCTRRVLTVQRTSAWDLQHTFSMLKPFMVLCGHESHHLSDCYKPSKFR